MAALLICAVRPALGAQGLPAASHGRLPYVALPQISPDGKRVAFVRQFAGDQALAVFELGKTRTGRFEHFLGSFEALPPPAPALKPESLYWINDGQLLITHTITLPPKGRSREPIDAEGLLLFDGVDGFAAQVKRRDLWARYVGPGTGDGPLLELFEKKVAYVAAYDVKGGKERAARDRAPPTGGKSPTQVVWLPGPDGRVLTRLFVVHPPAANFAIQVRDSEDATAWRTVWSWAGDITEGKADFMPLGFAEDPGQLYGLVTGEGRRMAVAAMDLRTGAIGKPVFALDRYDVDGARTDPYTEQVVGFSYSDDRPSVHWIDAEMQALQTLAESRFPGQRVELDSWSKDRKAVLVKVEGPRDPGSYWALRTDGEAMEKIGDLYPAVPADAVAPVQAISYEASDGQQISGYLTLPPGKTARGLPLILMPHGGPAARDVEGFDWWAQALALKGYAVLQPNYRGSSGFGLAFEEAGEKQWGRRMQADLTDGVAALAQAGTIDPMRVCIVGASYGGYAALAGATLTPDLYRCAVSVAGVGDLPAMIEYSRGKRRDSFALRYWSRVIGDPLADKAMLVSVSPRFQAASAKAPILLIHGRNDTVVPMSQSTGMRDALLAAGKPVTFLDLYGTDHFLRNETTRTEVLSAIFDFLAKHNPAD